MRLALTLLQIASDGPPHRFGVRRVGKIAFECLGRKASGTVVAVFDSSFYFTSGRAHICVGSSRIGMGPLNLRSTAPFGFDWAGAGIRVGDTVLIRNEMLQVGRNVVFDLAGLASWQPRPVEVPLDAQVVAAGLDALDRIGSVSAPADGLAALVWGGDRRPSNPVLDLAAAPAAGLNEWLARAFRDLVAPADAGPDGISVLLGLGPGLTPSGDDLVGGVLIALNALHRQRDMRLLADAMRRHVDEQTSPLSAAHLSAAARGMGAETLHDVLESLLTGVACDLEEQVGRLARIGHTSGWDALAGVTLALRAWLSSNTRD